MPHGKLGALPRDMSRPAPELGDYLLSANPLPTPPAIVDRAQDVATWPMYRNDTLGDCTVAAMFHIFGSMTAYSGQAYGGVQFSDDEAVKVYSAVSGYDPVTGEGDNGAQLADVCRYMVATGATDTAGKLHKLAAWAEITSYTNLALLKKAANAFGAVYLAINCPQSALDQHDQGEPWTVVDGSPVEGGHAIDLQWSGVGAPVWDNETVITWGAEQKMNEAFARAYIVEAVAVVSADDVNVQRGRNPVGLDLGQLVADCQAKYLV